MNIEQALKVMYEGGSVESLVSNTAYNLEKLEDGFRLCAEGLQVDLTYLTKEEIQGEFKEIYILETQEQFNNLNDEERAKLIDKTFEGVNNKRKFDKEIRGIS
ncbi:hypothetical protein [Clostridium frigidicarnis]|uniref:Uncharacterized protein n=1 Tax=Clostridium frigidicarnis TaxID=84698 RepID=A0A1I0V2Q8_9CLOT|nr:hypothetical protein [Clostridium frigidicarnis]SFA70571.1 hypothetical protein SAMN04488528_1001117 [Clostridium frigidicarnis]